MTMATIAPIVERPARAAERSSMARGRVARPGLATAHRAEHPAATTDWQTAAIEVYRRELPGVGAALAADLRLRLMDLTGRLPAPEAIYVDVPARLAQVVLDGVIFRLQGSELVVMRACSWCGRELLASPPVRTRAELGYVLSAWEPRGPDCQPEDPPDWG
jgi:hypothetical protein